ncbi:hypothetical protein [Planctomycetes bacterium CA13]|uniref:hypothetical protein n=1 Tax=Novipirellula herctigrandis TaxID=2527986 RepID=UPI0011B6F939
MNCYRIGPIRLLVVVTFLASIIGGCANWVDRSTDSSKLIQTNNPLMVGSESSRSIVLSVGFHPIESEQVDADRIASLWQWVDEMVIEPGQRNRLADNGIRIGKVIREDTFRARLSEMSGPHDVIDMFLSEADVGSEVSQGSKRIPMRFGKRYELPLRQPRSGEHVTLVRLNDSLVGKTLLDPQYLLAITPTKASTAGQIRLQCRPEIQHGSMRQKWVSSDSALRIDSRRDTWSLESLDIEFQGSEGDLFLIAGSLPTRGFGKEMMTGNSADNIEQQVVVLLKIEKLPTMSESF